MKSFSLGGHGLPQILESLCYAAAQAESNALSNLTDCNVTYKRAALERIREVGEEEFHEPEVHGALQARGESLWFSPNVLVYQQHTMRLGEAVRDRYRFGRLFGSRRVMDAPMSRRLIYAAIAVFLPVILVARSAQHVFGKRCFIGGFFRALPALILLDSCWALGEGIGYLTGRAERSLTAHQPSGVLLPSGSEGA